MRVISGQLKLLTLSIHTTAEESEDSESEDEPAQSKKAKNSLLAVGYKGMSFVVRGDMVGVFENQKGSGKKLKVSMEMILA